MHMTTKLLGDGVTPSSCMRKMMLTMVIGNMLTVVPMGRENLTTSGLILFFSSRHFDVIGSAARLEDVVMTVGKTSMTLYMNRYGFLRVIMRNTRGIRIQEWMKRTIRIVRM